jgi:ring-1,2-phenylacetyl-CoA epoxidase subunit PaaC
MPSLPPIRPEDEAVAERPAPVRSTRRPTRTIRPAGYLLRLGDDALILGQRLGEWCGMRRRSRSIFRSPTSRWTRSARRPLLWARRAMPDELAFKRDVLDFRNCLLVEQPNGDFARTMVRQLLFSTWQHMLYQRLTASSTQQLSRSRQGGQGSRLPPRARRRRG